MQIDRPVMRLGLVIFLAASFNSFSSIVGPGSVVNEEPVVFAETTSQSIATGLYHTCALTPEGGVQCWGRNDLGQLGDGTNEERDRPVPVFGLDSGIVAVNSKGNTTCALTASGGVKCWGAGGSGQLGNNDTKGSNVPVDVSGLSTGVSAIAVGDIHVCALTTAGSVKCWGANNYSQLGNDSAGIRRLVPDFVQGLAAQAVAVSAGTNHTCVIETTGAVQCWGMNSVGQLGDGTVNGSPPFGKSQPVQVSGVGSFALSISSGADHTCVELVSTLVECWGANAQGQLGDGTKIARSVPVPVQKLDGLTSQLSAGAMHTCAINQWGAAQCWGANDYYQLGDGTAALRVWPGYVQNLRGLTDSVTALSAGIYHSCAFTGSGSLKCWGLNAYGELGDGKKEQSVQPVPVLPAGIGPQAVVMVATGENHTCVLTEQGGVKCWGSNQYGQLGDGSTTPRYTVSSDVNLPGKAKAIVAGLDYACALIIDGGVLCWGNNGYQQLGDSLAGPQRSTPGYVSGLTTGVSSLAAGAAHTCAVMDHSVKCWGSGESGQLGHGVNANSSTPLDVLGLPEGILAVTAGAAHTCAITPSGGVKCWGANTAGQLGNNTTIGSNTPVDVSSLNSGVAALGAGNGHTCAVMVAGGVKCWGWNMYGTLGDNTTIERHIPVDVLLTSESVLAVAAGENHTCAVTHGGRLLCWGINSDGALGNGSGIQSHVPAYVASAETDFVSLDTRHYHACAVTIHGNLSCWGRNYMGQLGRNPGWLPVSVAGFGSFLDLPLAYSTFAQAALGNVGGQGSGRVNSWFDHTFPNYGINGDLTRWDAQVFTSRRQGVSWYDGHNGIDFSYALKATNQPEPVLAAAPGVVLATANNPLVTACKEGSQKVQTCGAGYGNQVWLDHQNGYATLYGHLHSISVTVGVAVTTGQPLGIMGDTGNSDGTHLHFGTYYDRNRDGQWTQDEVVDPYGWWGAGVDPCVSAMPARCGISRYLWNSPVLRAEVLTPTGTLLVTPSGAVVMQAPAGSVGITTTVELGDAPMPAEPSAQLRSAGQTFWLRIPDAPLGGASRMTDAILASSFANPITLTVAYGENSIRHLDELQLTLFHWEGNTSAWQEVSTVVETERNRVTSQTTQTGLFSLQVPLLCSGDGIEPNDSYDSSGVVVPGDNLNPQRFDIALDEDWFRLETVQNSRYTFRTTHVSAGIRTVVEVYDQDGLNKLATSPVSGLGVPSQLEWNAPASGLYFVRIRPGADSITGCAATYDFGVVVIGGLYLPFVMR